jgi:hypothetical protein
MDTRDDDIEFDFFDDEPPTGEAAAPPRSRLPGRPVRGPRRPIVPPRGTTPVLRLLALVVFVVFLVLVFALLIESCASSSKQDAYASYMEDVRTIAAQSTQNGTQVVDVLTEAGLTLKQIQNRLRGIAQREQQNLQAAQALDPPGRLRDENVHVIEALALRVSGAEGLANTFRNIANSEKETDAALLVQQANRLVASDVIWEDLFKALATEQLQADDVSGVEVPNSKFVQNPDLVTEESMQLIISRLRGASTDGESIGPRGTNIVSVTARPGGQTLTLDTLTTVVAGVDLAFDVVVEDSGDSQEVGIEVTLTVDKTGNPIVKTQTIDVINPGEQTTLTFTDFVSPPFQEQTTVRVDVATVENETNKDNNSAQYPVIFSLP